MRLENCVGAELLRAQLLGAARPMLAGRYEIHGMLGRGASGVVVRAMDLRLEREVALKLVPVSGPVDEVHRKARTLAKIEHRHIVPVYDVELVEAVIGTTAVPRAVARSDGLTWLRAEHSRGGCTGNQRAVRRAAIERPLSGAVGTSGQRRRVLHTASGTPPGGDPAPHMKSVPVSSSPEIPCSQSAGSSRRRSN